MATGRKLKFSAVVDQTLDAEVQPLTHEVNRMYEAFTGPSLVMSPPESEPTGDQLAAVRQLIASGSTPYVDFAVYGPHGLRLLRRLTFQAITLDSMGEWQRKEMPGPPNHEAWFAIFRCVRTTFLLLDRMSVERMDAYTLNTSDPLRRGSAETAGTLCTLYTADVRMRSEQFERIRRRLHSSPSTCTKRRPRGTQ